ncbi:MAG: hypothetical protein M3R12_01690 [Actinomycetota bacterium]|nr:hypothetical protein [Actinomycetota bacterium]
MTSEHERRLAENEALFRDVNERVHEQAEAHGADDHVYAYFCECSRTDCLERVRLTAAQYEVVRAHGARFILVAGHQIDAIEDVVAEGTDSVVVEKGAAGDSAEALDPRAA